MGIRHNSKLSLPYANYKKQGEDFQIRREEIGKRSKLWIGTGKEIKVKNLYLGLLASDESAREPSLELRTAPETEADFEWPFGFRGKVETAMGAPPESVAEPSSAVPLFSSVPVALLLRAPSEE